MSDLGPDDGINRLQHPDCRACKERERLNVGLLAENVQLKKKLGEGGGDVDAKAVAARISVAEGGSVQCGGVALAQLREQAIEMRERVGRAAFFDRNPDLPPENWDKLTDSQRGTYEGNAMAAVEAVFDALAQRVIEDAVANREPLPTQQSSGGQEGGVEEGADEDERWSEAEQERHEAAAEIHADWEREAEEDE